MGYADYRFYKADYYGEVLESDIAPKWLERASDALDRLTHGRLETAFPASEPHVVKIKKAVCAMADALYLIDVQRRAVSAQKADDGSFHGAVSSISSGRESVSYLSGGSNQSVYAAAAASEAEKIKLLVNIAATYIAGIPDSNGVNLLYGGADRV